MPNNAIIQDLPDLLEKLIGILARPTHIRAQDNFVSGVNVINSATTASTVSTITAGTLTTLTQIGGNPAAEPMLISPSRKAWMNSVGAYM